MAIALNGIGNVFVNIKDYEKALYYFRKALKIEEDNNNKRGIEYDSANIGEVYIQNQQYDSAQVYLDRALKLSKINPRKDGIGIKHNLLGQLYQKKQNYKKSNEHYLASIEIFKAHNNSRYLSNTLINIGINKLYTQEFVQADQYIKEGLLIAKKISSKENILLGYNALSIYFNKQHHYKEALASFQMAVKFKDSMLNEASQKSIISTQIAFEAMEKNKLIQALNEEKKQNAQKAKDNYRNMIWMAIIGSILLLSLVVFIVLYRKNIDLELQKKNVELRQYVHQIDELKNETKQIEAQRQASLSSNMEKFDLSEREKEVLKLIAQGFKNSEIAAQLFVSNNTIKTHIKNIYIKLDVQNRIQAMKKVGV
jgi:ATP/maltotriose-dependent transcriptional regulator MalT